MSTLFEKELEFVQLLCNPEYLRWLYKEGHFARSDFKDYLRHLLYFKDPKYSRFLVYPQCIPILEKLIQEDILKELSEDSFYTKLSESQLYVWRNRT